MIHKYLRAIGFSGCKTREDIQKIIVAAVRTAGKKEYTTIDEDVLYSEYHAAFGERIGLIIRGEYDEDKFVYDYYIPYLEGKGITSSEDISIERHISGMSFSGIVEDNNIGVSIIFYLQNIITYLKLMYTDRLPMRGTSLTLSALSDGGIILMPISKDEESIRKAKFYNTRKSHMLQKARSGDEAAMEHLTIDDMDTYNMVHRRMKEEDVYSLVDTYFMPYGVECDLYSILGEITDYQTVTNEYTKEKIYILTLNVNELIFDVAVNCSDVLGEVCIGRRFKGVIWLQGRINYPDM